MSKSTKKWGRKATGAKDLPTMGQLVKEERKTQLVNRPMSMEDKLRALELYADLQDVPMVATKMNRSEESLRKFFRAYQSTTTGARLKLEAGAEKLAKRVIKDANVEESLEVLDRLDVLPRVDRAKATPQSQFNVIIGMPTTGPSRRALDAVPVPTEEQVKKALEGEVTRGEN